jgi:molecular chaperone GrpE
MAERTTTAPGDGERAIGEEPEARAASAVLDDLESLRSRVTVAEQERDEYLGLLQRTRADFENYQKRIQRDLAQERRYAHAAFARELLPVLDNRQRALEAARQQAEKGPLIQGVALVQSQLLDLFGRFGVTPIDARGQPFDPHLHEAVRQQPRNDVPPGTVVEVLEPGYRLHERVLRPARVVVAAPPPPS